MLSLQFFLYNRPKLIYRLNSVMGKIIRPRYSIEISIGLLLLVFALSFVLAGQIFQMRGTLNEGKNIYVGMFLVSAAVIVMLLVLWEELLFPVTVKPTEGGEIFRNHRSKLKTQALIFCAIPLIFIFIYLEYEVKLVRFFIWAAVCIIAPVVGKLISGINNYNDFLKLTSDTIEYKNNKEVGSFKLNDVHHIKLVRDERNTLHKIHLTLSNNNQVTIDLDEMELEAFYVSIDKFITDHYKNLVKV
jgi:hypothetical protein